MQQAGEPRCLALAVTECVAYSDRLGEVSDSQDVLEATGRDQPRYPVTIA